MPLHDTAVQDPLTLMIRFKTSVVYEVLLSLQDVVDPWRQEELTQDIERALGRGFLQELRELYGRFLLCCTFIELPVDFENHDDFSAYLSYIESMTPRIFTFYLLGRYLPLEVLPRKVTRESLQLVFEASDYTEQLEQQFPNLDWAEDIRGMQEHLVLLWRTYWDNFFESKMQEIIPKWRVSIGEQQDELERTGGTALYQKICRKDDLPRPIPADVPLDTIEFVPIVFTSRRATMFYGYGKITVLYDSKRTQNVETDIESRKGSALAVVKALADENRLKILRYIAQYNKSVNGRKISEHVDLSTSVVSRHLTQLKNAGLLEEDSPDNRNIYYGVRFKVLAETLKNLEMYLKT